MSEPSKKVYVIIVTYNGTQWIAACLTSLQVSTYPCEVVVVDNASSDETVDLIRNQFPTVKVLRQTHNLGFGKANNIGIEWSLRQKADAVFLLNQDTTVDAMCIGRLVHAADSGQYDVLSPVHLNDTGTGFDGGFKRYVKPHFNDAVMTEWMTNPDNHSYPIGFVNAAAWYVPVDTLKRIGGFAPLFYHYGEDRDFINRVEFKGGTVGLVPAASIRHYRETRNVTVSKWTNEKKIKYYTVGVLSRLSNVNRSSLSGRRDAWMWLLKESVALFLKGDVRAVFRFFTVAGKVLAKSQEVRAHRMTVKEDTSFKFLVCE